MCYIYNYFFFQISDYEHEERVELIVTSMLPLRRSQTQTSSDEAQYFVSDYNISNKI